MGRTSLLFFFCALLLLPPAALAEPAVPPQLAPWVPWVLDEHPELGCPLVGGARLCAWPGVLELTLDERGGGFTLRVHADRQLDLALPGDAARFPREVTLDGKPALLRRLGDTPAVALPRGEHQVAGRFVWQRLPESLPVPAEIAIVALRVRGERVARPHREASGLLWLAAREAEAGAEDSLAIEVYRRIGDGVPALLETRLLLRVAGAARELDLGEVLPPGFEPYQLETQLPARYGRDRRLRVQLRPGEWSLRLAARGTGPLVELAGAERPAPWPTEEIWVFAADPAVRAVRLEGGASIDPQRTSLPEEWKSLPAFQIAPTDVLRFAELRRGEPQPPPDEIAVSRTFWLALSGDRITSRDQLSGVLHQGGRLEALPPAELGRASFAGADQVITRSPASGGAGVEVRAGALDLSADATYPGATPLPAVGWNRDASSLGVDLRVPPGWSLFATSGVDLAPDAWVDRWSLLDFFLLLILVLGLFKLEGLAPAAVALPVLVLGWHERYSPALVWLLLALLAARGLARLRPEGAPRRWLRLAITVALLATLLLFVRWQWRIGRHPQLDQVYGGSFAFSPAAVAGGRMANAAPEGAMVQQYQELNAPAAPADEAVAQGSFELDKASRSGSYSKAPRAKQVDPNAVVQTGPGVPSWTWRSYSLGWQGPVKADQELRLYLISPGLGLVLALLRIALWLALLALLFGWRGGLPRALSAGASGGDGDDDGAGETEEEAPAGAVAALVALAAGLALSLATALPARAEEPPVPAVPAPVAGPGRDLLAELEARLTRPPECAPNCLELSRLVLRAGPAGLEIEADVHAAAETAWALPGPASSFVPAEVSIDGRPATALRLDPSGFLQLRLEPGVHRVLLRGPARDSLSLQFPLPPRALSFTGQGFTIDGFREDEPPPGLVRLDRTLPSGEDSPAAAVELQPWLELARQFDIGLPWMVHYQLRRLSPEGAAVLLRVPLLPGEAVTSAGVPVEGGEALVSLEPGETQREWSTTLAERPSLELEAPAGRPWLERWELLCSPVWHCGAAGLDPVRHMAEGEWRPEWRPWPGEKLKLDFVRPEGAPGQTITLDQVNLHLAPGRRLLEGTLTIDARASRGGEQKVGLPADAELLGFTIDGNAVPAQNLDGQVTYTLEPGARTIQLRWRQNHDAGLFERMPAVEIPGEAANVVVEVEVPMHRWLLTLGGPDWGPVVLFWQDLVAILLAALALGRWARTPLRTADWMLLGVGLTQVPFPAALVVVLWLIALGWRRRPERPWLHDLTQLLLLVFGVVTLVVLVQAIHSGLLYHPDMQFAGGGSSSTQLSWLAERVSGTLPQPWLVSVPLWVYRVLMLLWALWLAARLLRWLPWCWQQLSRGGKLFRLPDAWRAASRRRREELEARRAAMAGMPGPPPPSGSPPGAPPPG